LAVVFPAAARDHLLPLRRSSTTAWPASGWRLQSETTPAIRPARRAAVTRVPGRFPSRRTPRIDCIAFAAFQSVGRMPLMT
jgi:hypothetical protein